MLHRELQLPRIVALVVLATALGMAILQVDSTRRAESDLVANAAPIAPAATPAATPTPATPGEIVAQPAPPPVEVIQRRGGVVCNEPHRLVQVNRDVAVHATPAGRSIGAIPGLSRYLGQPMTAWVQAVSADGLWGKVTLPWRKPVGQAGWIRLDGFAGRTTTTMLVADLGERRVRVYRGCDELFSVSSAIGRPGSPSPTGRFWVTDRVAVPRAQQGSFGTFAFGLSTV